MTTWNPRANELFLQARELRSPSERQLYLDGACAGDTGLRAEVEGLLEAAAQAGSFLESPAPQLAGTAAGLVNERPGTIIGAYKLLEQIGEGGFGVVFMAEQTRPVRRKVALKVLKPGMDTRQVVGRFEAERQALALMDHPNIAHVFDGGATATGRPYFVMELVRGIPISNFCDQNQLPIRERLALFVDVCQAVQHAHQKGIIHRDLKPSNVLVSMHDTTPVVKVIDFGVAKALGQELTDKTLFTGFVQLIGTPMYMSPEQAGQSGLDVDTRSDIYALGVLLYELLTGTTPFDNERLRTAGYDEIFRIIREEEAPRPSTRVSTLGQAAATVSAKRRSEPQKLRRLMRGELDWVVMKALEKDRSRRYESASALAADVKRYLADEPVLACPPSASYRFRKFFRRNKAGLSILGLVLFFVVLIGGGAGWAVRDRAARQARLNLEVEHALDEAAKTREQAVSLTDNPALWAAALAEAASDLKRARGLATQDDAVVEPVTRERLQALQALLDADEADRRFAARFEEVRLEQTEVNLAISQFKTATAFAALKEAFRRHYGVEFGTTGTDAAAAVIQRRPKAIQDLLLAALEVALDNVPKDDAESRQWLDAVLEAADVGPWRKRGRLAVQTGDWKALEQVIEEAIAARQPPSLMLRLAERIPLDSPTRVEVLHHVRQTYPGDFWANYALAFSLQYGQPPRPEEALRYHTAALALRPHNPAECVNLGNGLVARGDLDGAIRAYREALDRHPDYAAAHERLGLTLEQKGDADAAIVELRETIRLRSYVTDHVVLGNMLARRGLGEEAIASYRRAIHIEPNYGLAHYNVGTVLLEKGCKEEAAASYREAIACYRRSVRLDPGSADSHNNLAWILVTCPYAPLRDLVEGENLARKAIELLPNNGAYWNTLGVAHYRAGDWKEAVAALTRSVQLDCGGNGYNGFFLALAHWRLGEREKSRQCFDQAAQWTDKNMPRSKELGRFRAEAAELINVQPKKD
jgi:serine/threonine protein kinase/Tfp pilus assembly protein PilF